jgi:hypothetical protein
MIIYGHVQLDLIGPGYTSDPGDPASGKPYLRLTFGHGQDAQQVQITTNIAEMIGGAGIGARKRWEDLQETIKGSRPQ